MTATTKKTISKVDLIREIEDLVVEELPENKVAKMKKVTKLNTHRLRTDWTM